MWTQIQRGGVFDGGEVGSGKGERGQSVRERMSYLEKEL